MVGFEAAMHSLMERSQVFVSQLNLARSDRLKML